MNQRDFLLTKINSGKAELERMPAFMQMEREYLQADIKEYEEELAKIPPGPNGEKIYVLNRQINAAKDYLRRLHPRFEEERKQREEFIQEKEAELMKLEKENGAKTPQLEPCPFCGSVPTVESTGIFCDYEGCYVQPSVCCEMPEFLPQLWNAMATIDCEDEKPESDKSRKLVLNPEFHQPVLNPCVRCGGLGLIEGDSTERRAWCYSCDNEIIIKGKSTEKQIIDAWNEENPILNPCDKCGIPPKRRNYPDTAMVYCPECMDSSIGKTMAEAVRKWNEKNPDEAESDQNNANETPETRRDQPISFFEVNPCSKCGYDPQTTVSSEMVTIYCPKCTRVSQFKDRNKAIEIWNQQNPLKAESSESDSDGPFKPCAKCGSPVEWSISFSRGDEGFVKCPRCGNGITFNNGDFSSVDEVVEKWNQVNTKPENQIPPKFSQVMKEIEQRIPVNMLNKLYLLNSILGLQRDEKGPVIEVKKIQETILEIDRTLQKGEIWKNDEAISELTKQSEEMKSDEYLAPSESRKIAVHGSVYVTALHIAGAVCREAEMYAWEYEQKHGLEELSQVCKYLDQLAEWLFVRAEYLRETEECF